MKVPTRRFGRTEVQMPVLTCGGMRYQQAWEDLKEAHEWFHEEKAAQRLSESGK